MFLEDLCCCLSMWRSSHILHSLPALGGKYLLSSQLRILRISQAFSMYMPDAHFLFPLGGHFLRFHAFCSFYKARPCADILPFSFPRVVLSVQVWELSPNPAEPGWLLCMLISYLQRLAPSLWGSVQGASHGVGVMWGRFQSIGVTCGPAGEIYKPNILQQLMQASWWSLWSHL